MRAKLILFGLLVAFVSMIGVRAQTPVSKKKILVAYFSHSGNTKAVATSICKKTDAEIFGIKTVKPYPNDYSTVVEVAKKELHSDYRPALTNNIKDIKQYEIIFIGYPNWWGTYPQAVKVFLSMNNLAGKTIIPFCTHEGSAFGNSLNDLKTLCPKSILKEGLAISGGMAHNSDTEIQTWLKKLKLIK